MDAYRDYSADLMAELAYSVAIETILKKHEVKCRDWIGLVEELHDLHKGKEQAP